MYFYSLDPKYRLKRIKLIADYQFGFGCGDALFDETCTFILSKTKRVKQVIKNDDRLITIRANDGFMTLSITGAKILHQFLKYPQLRVVISDDAVPYVSNGKTVFSKHVIAIDSNLRCKDEVLVVDSNDNLIATGQIMLSPLEALYSDFGPSVDVRYGIKK